MPHFNVQIFEEALDTEVETKLIRSLTEAVVDVYGDFARELAVVEIFGVPKSRWGVAGKPAGSVRPLVTLNMREPALSRPGVENPPARLIEAITNRVCEVLGEDVRKDVDTLIVGIPTGRSGVAGEPV